MQPSTGYGHRTSRLVFNGDESKYELWEVKFLGYLKIHQLHELILSLTVQTDLDFVEKDAELIQFLDDTSLSVVIREAQDNGKKALAILREHYLPKGKPKIVPLYTELTSLKNSNLNRIYYKNRDYFKFFKTSCRKR